MTWICGSEEYFYLAIGSPNRENNKNAFNGMISEFAIYDCLLKDKEIKILSDNVLENSLLENFSAAAAGIWPMWFSIWSPP